MASETVDPIDWSHPIPYTGQYPLSSTFCTVHCGLQITRLAALSQPRTCDLRNARPTHCLCGHLGYMKDSEVTKDSKILQQVTISRGDDTTVKKGLRQNNRKAYSSVWKLVLRSTEINIAGPKLCPEALIDTTLTSLLWQLSITIYSIQYYNAHGADFEEKSLIVDPRKSCAQVDLNSSSLLTLLSNALCTVRDTFKGSISAKIIPIGELGG